jgi:type VI secretion system protein ImpJ
MFLRPHHFQALDQHWAHLFHLGESWDQPHYWGLREIEIDADALKNHRLVVRSLRARMRDGTLVCVPQDGVLPELELKKPLAESSPLTVFLAVPVYQVTRANVPSDGKAAETRWLVHTDQREDENTGGNPQPIDFRLSNLKLLLATDNRTGYEVLEVGRIRKSGQAEGLPEVDPAYIPPLLACSAWPVLKADILQSIYDRIGPRMDTLVTQVTARGITFDSVAQGDRRILEQLRILNEAAAVLDNLSFVEGIHPFWVYVELCRFVGRLAIFDQDRHRCPRLPRYDHDDLGGCFYAVRHYIDLLLDKLELPGFESRPFEGAALRMQVTLDSKWLDPNWQMYVGVKSMLKPEKCVELLTGKGLPMKIGSADRVDAIFARGEAGLRFSTAVQPPSALPRTADLTYFQVDRDSQQKEWLNVQQSLTLAIRLNERIIVGKIDKQQILTIRTDGQDATLQFTLYVVKQGT